VYHSGSTDVLCEGTVDALGIWSCAVTGLSDGVHSLELIARNSLGNESAPVAYVVTIDTVVPAELLIVDVIPQSQSLSNSSYPVFSGSLVSEAGSSVRVYESGQLVCEAQVLDTGEWACATLNQQTDGEHVFSIRVIDRAGNQSVPVELVLHIDATNPRVVSVSTPLSAGTYDVGDIIPIDVRFSEVVSVLGSVRLKIGPGEQYAEFSSLDEAATLDVIRLNYVVKEGDVISRLEYGGAGAFELLSGTIRDAAQNNAELTLPIPGAPGSLSADGSPVIVVSAPSTPIRRNSIVPLPGVSVYTNPKVPISGAAGSATPGSLIDIYYGRIKLCRSTVKPDGSWSCTIPVLLPGKHTFVLKLKLPGSSTWSSMDLVVTAKSSVQIKRCPAFRPARVIGYRGSDVIVLRLFLNTYTDAGLPLSDVYDQQLHDYIGSLVRARYHVPVLHCFTWWRI
jgi:hypothetical protein